MRPFRSCARSNREAGRSRANRPAAACWLPGMPSSRRSASACRRSRWCRTTTARVKRVLGLYALTGMPFAAGERTWQRHTRQVFARPAQGAAARQRRLPPLPAARAAARRAGGAGAGARRCMAAAPLDALGIPQIDEAGRERLFDAFAPSFEIATACRIRPLRPAAVDRPRGAGGAGRRAILARRRSVATGGLPTPGIHPPRQGGAAAARLHDLVQRAAAAGCRRSPRRPPGRAGMAGDAGREGRAAALRHHPAQRPLRDVLSDRAGMRAGLRRRASR